MKTKSALLTAALALTLAGCMNHSQVSKLEDACHIDGECLSVAAHLHGGIVAGKQIVVVDVKRCHKDTGPHNIIEDVKEHKGRWVCSKGITTTNIDDGMAEKMISGSVGLIRHSNYDGDDHSTSVTSTHSTKVKSSGGNKYKGGKGGYGNMQ